MKISVEEFRRILDVPQSYRMSSVNQKVLTNKNFIYSNWFSLNQENKSISQIAKIIKRNKSTISREIKRNKIKKNYEANYAMFHSKIINLTKHKFSICKYQEFLNYFYNNFNSKYFGVAACIFSAKKLNIQTPTIKTVYNWINFSVIKTNSKQLLRPWKRSYFKK